MIIFTNLTLMILIIVGVRILRFIRLVGMKMPIVTIIKFGQTKLMMVIKAKMMMKEKCLIRNVANG